MLGNLVSAAVIAFAPGDSVAFETNTVYCLQDSAQHALVQRVAEDVFADPDTVIPYERDGRLSYAELRKGFISKGDTSEVVLEDQDGSGSYTPGDRLSVLTGKDLAATRKHRKDEEDARRDSDDRAYEIAVLIDPMTDYPTFVEGADQGTIVSSLRTSTIMHRIKSNYLSGKIPKAKLDESVQQAAAHTLTEAEEALRPFWRIYAKK
ncbi:MAG: hypothetical protein ABH879_08375 [archaeon]